MLDNSIHLGIISDTVYSNYKSAWQNSIQEVSMEKKKEITFEHRDIIFCQKSDLPLFLEQNRGSIVPSGEAALSLYLKHYSRSLDKDLEPLEY